MKLIINILLAFGLLLTACDNQGDQSDHDHDHAAEKESSHHGQQEESEERVHLSQQQFASLGMKIDTLPKRNMGSYVEANGQLEVPPQNEATVTAIIGANVTSIEVIEGDKISKGQALAYLSHPKLIQLQTDYISQWNALQFIEQEYLRQQKLHEEKVGTGSLFQKAKADYLSNKGQVKGLAAQLVLLGLDPDVVQTGEIFQRVPVRSPIDGHVRQVEVKTGQYVDPQKEMFEVVNIDHIHADLMVFEKDMHKVHDGQQIKFSVESLPNEELEATIYSVGKAFEEGPKAIHIHAEIENKKSLLIPGMYVRGRILVDNKESYALPEAAVVREGEKYYLFGVDKESTGDWIAEPIEVLVGKTDNNWIEVKALTPFPKGMMVGWNNAYYLLAEMKKGEAEHEH